MKRGLRIIGESTFTLIKKESELRRELEKALLRHDDIKSLSSFSVLRMGTTLDVSFTLSTVYGEITEEYVYGT